MRNSAEAPHIRTDVLLQIVSVVVFWLIAFFVWWASLWHADLFREFGADLPFLTKAIVWGARSGLPFMLAALFSGVVIFRIRVSRHQSTAVTAWLLVVSILCSTFAMIGMTLPITKACGELVPGWPPSIVESGGGDVCGG